MTHIWVSELAIIGSDNGLSPGRRQAIISTNAGILLIGPLGTNISEILFGIQTFSFNKMHFKMSSARWRPFCVGLNVLILSKYTVVTSDICIHNQLRCLQWIIGIHGLPETISVHCSQKLYVITLAVRPFVVFIWCHFFKTISISTPNFKHTESMFVNMNMFSRCLIIGMDICCLKNLGPFKHNRADTLLGRFHTIDLFHNNFPLADSSPNTVN